MKKIIMVIALTMTSGMSFGQALKLSDQVSTPSSSNSSSVAAASNQGNSQAITFTAPSSTTSSVTTDGKQTVNESVSGAQTQNINYGGSQTVRNVPSVSGPNLTSSNDTCMGAASGSANLPGFGLSLGKTYTDTNSVMLKNSRELLNMGMKGAALALMCTDPANKDALELTGYECPQTTKAKNAQDTAITQNQEV